MQGWESTKKCIFQENDMQNNCDIYKKKKGKLWILLLNICRYTV